jgi:hypothetical protein
LPGSRPGLDRCLISATGEGLRLPLEATVPLPAWPEPDGVLRHGRRLVALGTIRRACPELIPLPWPHHTRPENPAPLSRSIWDCDGYAGQKSEPSAIPYPRGELQFESRRSAEIMRAPSRAFLLRRHKEAPPEAGLSLGHRDEGVRGLPRWRVLSVCYQTDLHSFKPRPAPACSADAGGDPSATGASPSFA